MPITYAVDVENMTVRLHASNPLTADDLETYYRVSRADPRVSPDMHRIVDLRAIAPMPGCADVVRVARSRRGAEPIGPGGTNRRHRRQRPGLRGRDAVRRPRRPGGR